jgi:DNA polymerase-3 subunit delta
MPAPHNPGAADPPPQEPAQGPTGLYYLFHGDDELGIAESLAALRRRLAKGDSAMAELNTSVLDGRQLTFGELRHLCDAIPFLNDRRLIIVHDLLARLAPERRAKDEEAAPDQEAPWRRQYIQDLTDYLPRLPPTTRLVFVEGKLLADSHPILSFAAEEARNKRGAHVKAHAAPKRDALPGWILDRARLKGGAISTEAAALLSDLIGSDLLLLDLELEKLLLYAEGRQVTSADVRALVSRARETNVFDMVDSMGRRQAAAALKLLHGLWEDGEPPLYVLAMLARQVRLLIQVSELQARGVSALEMARQLGQRDWLLRKLLAQAAFFSMDQLESAHRAVVETDWAIKTGEMDGELALDLLVARLCGGPER